MNKILTAIGVCLAIVLGAKFYLEYRYKKELDNLLRGASLVAEVDYKDLNVGFDGAVELLGLSVTPNGTFNTFKVKSITLSGLDLMFHFNGESRLKEGKLPNFLKIAVEQFSFPTTVYEEHISDQECKSYQGFLLYSAAGYDEILMDAQIRIDMADPFAASLTFNGSDQISRLGFLVDFNARELTPSAMASQIIPVQSMRYDFFLEQAAAQAMLAHCAKEFKVTPEVYLDKVIKSDKFMANTIGLDFGEKAQEAMASFLQGGKEISILSTPSDRLKNYSFAASSSPAQIARMLNMTVTLDGDNVPVSTFQSFSGVDEEFIEEENDDEQEGYQRRDLEELLSMPDGTVQERNKPTLRRKRKDKYEDANIARVKDYIDRDVRLIRTDERSPIEGRLLGLSDGVLEVEIYRYGGVMTYTVDPKDVATFQVKKRR